VYLLNVRDIRFPGGTEDVEGLREGIVVDETRVHGEGAHHHDDVAAIEYHAEYLKHRGQKVLVYFF